MQDIEEKDFGGRKTSCYVIKIRDTGLKVMVPTEEVIRLNTEKNGDDYRLETEGPNPVAGLRGPLERNGEATDYAEAQPDPDPSTALRYVYEPDRGPVPSNGTRSGSLLVSGQTLLDVARDEYANYLEAIQLMDRYAGEVCVALCAGLPGCRGFLSRPLRTPDTRALSVHEFRFPSLRASIFLPSCLPFPVFAAATPESADSFISAACSIRSASRPPAGRSP